MDPSPEERNQGILRRTLSAVSHLYAVYDLFFGWSLLRVPATGEGLHGSHTIGWISVGLGSLLWLAGWGLWRPRRGAWSLALAASLGSLALGALDLLGGRPASGAVDGSYGPVALGVYLLCRRRG